MASVNGGNVRLCRGWLLVGLHALGVSGILSVLVVFLRMPFLKSVIANADRVFDLALVIHVNLSVLVWLCSISCILICMTLQESTKYLRYSWVISAIGAILIALSTFMQDAVPIKSNYVPVIDNLTFFAGLLLFFAGVLLNSLPMIRRPAAISASPVSAGIYGISAMFTAVVMCCITSYSSAIPDSDRLYFYERVFWGAGHLMQGVFSQAFLVVLLLHVKNGRFMHPYLVLTVFMGNTVSVVLASVSHLIYHSDFEALAVFFSWHMRVAEALIPLFLVIFALANARLLLHLDNRHILYSTVMFIYGSILGIFSVQGTVVIPAHYHGCVVGMTAAFMGFVYWLLPEVGYKGVTQRWAHIQLFVYSAGQILHITGLELLGGYGTLRKVTYLPDAVSKLAKYCFSVGGAMAVIGGSLFVVLVLVRVYRKEK